MLKTNFVLGSRYYSTTLFDTLPAVENQSLQFMSILSQFKGVHVFTSIRFDMSFAN